MAEIVCTVCNQNRPDRGTCRSCRTRLCFICHEPLPAGRREARCCECNRKRAARWRDANPERSRETSRKWREANPERRKSVDRNWRHAHTEKNREHSRKWYETNPERGRARSKEWRQTNPEKVRDQKQRRRARLKGCETKSVDLLRVIEESNGLCALCRTYVPQGLRHIDHIMPLAKGGPHSNENLQLLCYRCNCRKRDRLPNEVKPENWSMNLSPLQHRLLNPDWK